MICHTAKEYRRDPRSYWNIGIGRQIGDVKQGRGRYCHMKTLGRNMVWLLENLKCPMAMPERAEIVSQ